jgi:ribose transport system substrate-binding protein
MSEEEGHSVGADSPLRQAAPARSLSPNEEREEMNVRRLISWITLTAMLAVVVGCGSDDSGDSGSSSEKQTNVSASTGKVCVDKKTVGYVDIFAASPIETSMKELSDAAVKSLGWDMKFVDAAGDFTKMQQAIQSFVTQKVDFIIVASADAAPIRQGLQAAKNANIPVVEIGGGNLDPEKLFSATYNEDEKTLGKMLAEHIVKSVPNAQIADLATTLNYSGKARGEGLKEAVDESGGKAEIAASQQVDSSNVVPSTTKTLTDMLTAHPDINAVYATFDSMATPAANAVRTKNSKAKVYTTFATPSNLELMSKGQMGAVIDANLAVTPAVAFDQFLNVAENGGEFDPNAIEKAGGLGYRIVTDPKQTYDVNETFKPFLEKWSQDYAC